MEGRSPAYVRHEHKYEESISEKLPYRLGTIPTVVPSDRDGNLVSAVPLLSH